MCSQTRIGWPQNFFVGEPFWLFCPTLKDVSLKNKSFVSVVNMFLQTNFKIHVCAYHINQLLQHEHKLWLWWHYFLLIQAMNILKQLILYQFFLDLNHNQLIFHVLHLNMNHHNLVHKVKTTNAEKEIRMNSKTKIVCHFCYF